MAIFGYRKQSIQYVTDSVVITFSGKLFNNTNPRCNYNSKLTTGYIIMTYCITTFRIEHYVQRCTGMKKG